MKNENRQRLRESREYKTNRNRIILQTVTLILANLIFGYLILDVSVQTPSNGDDLLSICLFVLIFIDLLGVGILLYSIYRVWAILRKPDSYTFTTAQVMSSRISRPYLGRSRTTKMYLTLRFNKANGLPELRDISRYLWWGEVTFSMAGPTYVRVAFNEETSELVTFS